LRESILFNLDHNNSFKIESSQSLTKTDSVALKENVEEQRRKEIFVEDGRLYKVAVEKAMEKYPNDLKKQTAYQEKIEKIFRKRLEINYGLKKGELDAII